MTVYIDKDVLKLRKTKQIVKNNLELLLLET